MNLSLPDCRILLINVSEPRGERVYREYPLGLGFIGTVLHEAAASVEILDLALDPRSLATVLATFRPTMVGCSFLSTSWPLAQRVLTELHTLFAGPIIAGGIHTTLFPEEVLRAGFTAVICGEGDRTIVALAQALHTGIPTLNRIPGVAFLDAGQLAYGPPATPVLDLDALPWVNRDLYALSHYHHHSVMTSRGCPYHCKFCCNWGVGVKQCRSRSPANVVAELGMLVQRYQARVIYFADDLLFFTKQRRLEFCHLLEAAQLDIEWVAQLRVDSVDRTLLAAMRRAGCTKICFGVEAGSQAILARSGKHTTVAQIRHAIQSAHAVGMRTKTWWILGLPGTYAEQMESLTLLTDLMPNEVSLHALIPLPGSTYWNQSASHGLHILDRNDFASLAYHAVPLNVQMDYLSREELLDLFSHFRTVLRGIGYQTTDEATEQSRLVLATPFEQRGFRI